MQPVADLPLQARIPSVHVWSNFLSPASPQFLNQAPRLAQQLSLPDFLAVLHLEHMTFAIIDEDVRCEDVVAAGRADSGCPCQ